MFEWLKGKKTYIIAAFSLLGSIGAFMSGTIDFDTLWNAVQVALVAFGLRAGINNAAEK